MGKCSYHFYSFYYCQIFYKFYLQFLFDYLISQAKVFAISFFEWEVDVDFFLNFQMNMYYLTDIFWPKFYNIPITILFFEVSYLSELIYEFYSINLYWYCLKNEVILSFYVS